jgi:hypothetical protein
MNRHIELEIADRDESRPFAHTDHNIEDVAALAIMVARLRQFLSEGEGQAALALFQPYELHSPQGRRLRMVVNQPEALRAGRDLPLVGFFGKRRPVVPPDVDVDKDTIDLEMIAEFPNFPGVLAYCSMALNDVDFGNLVLLEHADYKEQWSTSARHAIASRVIAPQYYSTVRLHNGVLPGGLFGGQAPVLLRTKYYDYQGDWPWSAVRDYNQV